VEFGNDESLVFCGYIKTEMGDASGGASVATCIRQGGAPVQRPALPPSLGLLNQQPHAVKSSV